MNKERWQERQDLIAALKRHGIRNELVLHAFAEIPRHLFVPTELQAEAYLDEALPIGERQTISQPFIVARMTESLFDDRPLHRVLEIGTGSGFQAAILSCVADEVYTIERIQKLYQSAKDRFDLLDLKNIHTKFDDGSVGWLEHAPYDAIIVTAAAESVPQSLIDQLADNGRMIIPVNTGGYAQSLQLIIKQKNKIDVINLEAVLFVPLLKGKS